MPSPHKIAAVFATMNRAATAVACVRALAEQTRPPELVVVSDNDSSDDTVSALDELKDLPFDLVVQRMPENRGNAGGVEEAMEIAFTKGADAVWILDDDSWPRPGALAALLEPTWNQVIVRHALQVNPNTRQFSWPLWVDRGGGWELAFNESELPDSSLIPSKACWTGALVSRHIWNNVGPVLGDLFIRGEDEEYPWRIGKAGFHFEAVRDSVMDHPSLDYLIHWKIFRKNFFFERGLTDWKLYYKIRNMVWLKRRQSGILSAIGMAVIYTLAVIAIDGPSRIPLVRKAIMDACKGRLGKMEG